MTHGGCFYTKVTSSGVAASFCCGDGDCATAGAIPGGAKEKREMLPSRITRALRADTRKTEILQRTNAWDGVPLSPKAITVSQPWSTKTCHSPDVTSAPHPGKLVE